MGIVVPLSGSTHRVEHPILRKLPSDGVWGRFCRNPAPFQLLWASKPFVGELALS